MKKGYNERLFQENTLRGRLHFARYYWLRSKVAKYYPEVKSVLELGCFDGKTISFLPQSITLYHGFDANWERGLDEARKIYINDDRLKFIRSSEIEGFVPPLPVYDVSICMETLEHLPLVDLELYISQLRNSTKHFCFVTVPNEKGFVLILKYLIKKMVLRDDPELYSYNELLNGLFNRMKRIQRNEGGHKGFDYVELIDRLKGHFDIIEVNGIPLATVPKQLSFSIGVVLKRKTLS
ncbi:class I SAM-dependent methyltransferase [Pontibacter sp. CAU 1760]